VFAHCSLLESTDFPLVFALLVPSHLCSPSVVGNAQSPLRLPMRQLHRTRKSTESTTQLRPYSSLNHTQTPKSPYFQATCRLTPIATGRPYLRCPSPIYAGCQLAGHGSPFAPPIVATRDNTRLLCPAQSQQSSAAGTLDAWQISKSAWDLSRVCWGPRGDLTLHLAPCLLRSAPRSPTRESGPQPTSGTSGEGNPSYQRSSPESVPAVLILLEETGEIAKSTLHAAQTAEDERGWCSARQPVVSKPFPRRGVFEG